MFTLILLSFILCLSFISAQDGNCDFFQNVQPGSVYEISSPNYPASYPRGVRCRWIGQCPAGYNCRLDCPVVQLPQSPSCSLDRLLISRTGDPLLYGAVEVCGTSPFSVVSTAERMSLGLVTSTNSPGGAFKCQLYAQSASTSTPSCRCGERKQNRIVGGQETGVNEYKMMAGVISRNTEQVKCGGVIVSNRHVVTAAHCMVNEFINTTAVLVGDHNLSTGTDTNAARGYAIRRITIHPQYNPSNYDYDMAVLETATVIEFNEEVGPVCLPFKFVNFDFTGSNVTILGWGTTFPGGPRSNVLLKVDVKVISQSTCRASMATLTDQQICTFTPGKDACQYDSGGPVLYTDPSTGLQFSVGTVSYGRFCASNYPGVNTRITVLLDWIIANTGADFCRK